MGLIKKNLVQVDAETGEVQDGFALFVPTKRGLKDRHNMMTNPGLLALAMDADLKWEDWRVLAVYLSAMEFENVIDIPQKEVAEILQISKVNVSRATKKLVTKHILIEESKSGRSKVYRLNTAYGWKGKVSKEYSDLLDKDCRLLPKSWMKTPAREKIPALQK